MRGVRVVMLEIWRLRASRPSGRFVCLIAPSPEIKYSSAPLLDTRVSSFLYCILCRGSKWAINYLIYAAFPMCLFFSHSVYVSCTHVHTVFALETWFGTFCTDYCLCCTVLYCLLYRPRQSSSASREYSRLDRTGGRF